MVITLYFHCKIVNNYPGPNTGLGPRVNPGFGFEKPAGYPGLRGPGFGCPNHSDDNELIMYSPTCK